MEELASEEFARVRPLLPRGFGMAAAVLSGNGPGRVWVDDAARPTRALIGTVELWLLLGMPRDDGFDAELRELLEEHVFVGGAVRDDDEELLLSVHPPSWEERLGDLFGDRRYLPDPRAYLEVSASELVVQPVPRGYEFVDVDAALLARTDLANLERVADWIASHFVSTDDFLARAAATCAIAGDEIASWCVSDCVEGTTAEIGIHTADAHRRRGLAGATASASCRRLFESGVERIGWHCWLRNEASLKTAARIGLHKVSEYPAWFSMFDPVRDRLVHGWWYLMVGDDPRAAADELRAGLSAGLPGIEPGWFVHAARAEVRLGEDERALVCLRRARDMGWDGLDELAQDVEFARLLSDPAWELL